MITFTTNPPRFDLAVKRVMRGVDRAGKRLPADLAKATQLHIKRIASRDPFVFTSQYADALAVRANPSKKWGKVFAPNVNRMKKLELEFGTSKEVRYFADHPDLEKWVRQKVTNPRLRDKALRERKITVGGPRSAIKAKASQRMLWNPAMDWMLKRADVLIQPTFKREITRAMSQGGKL